MSDPKFALGLHDDPEFKARGWWPPTSIHFVGRLNQVGLLFDLSETPGRVQGPPLIVGQHCSREIPRGARLFRLSRSEDCARTACSPGACKEGHRKVRSPGGHDTGARAGRAEDVSQHDAPPPRRCHPARSVFTPDAAFFWEGVARGELLGSALRGLLASGAPAAPDVPVSARALKRETVKLSGRGTVYSWVIPGIRRRWDSPNRRSWRSSNSRRASAWCPMWST